MTLNCDGHILHRYWVDLYRIGKRYQRKHRFLDVGQVGMDCLAYKLGIRRQLNRIDRILHRIQYKFRLSYLCNHYVQLPYRYDSGKRFCYIDCDVNDSQSRIERRIRCQGADNAPFRLQLRFDKNKRFEGIGFGRYFHYKLRKDKKVKKKLKMKPKQIF